LSVEPITLAGFERTARERLAPATWDYIAAVADGGQTAANERAALDAIQLRPRVLRRVEQVSTAVELLGRTFGLPVLAAPTAVQRMAHPDGELAVLQACQARGTLPIVSSAASCTVAELEDSSAPWWLQLYALSDPGLADALVQRSVAAGAEAVVVTVDTPVIGRRAAVLPVPMQLLSSVLEDLGRDGASAAERLPMAPLDWSEIAALRERLSIPLLVKGVLHAADAARLAELGVDGIVVSTHGARQLDGSVGPAQVVSGIVDAVAGRCPVLADGNVRSGLDVLRLLVRGAAAVLIGRPVLWGLASDGAGGVERVLDALGDELRSAMALAGCATTAAIDRDLEWRGA
jgi:isopentenyl diphosphate isomerase/L-lactate dehydrogenase-like FMN-dependent dehydrogenase